MEKELAVPCNAKRSFPSDCTTPGPKRTPNANWKTGCNVTYVAIDWLWCRQCKDPVPWIHAKRTFDVSNLWKSTRIRFQSLFQLMSSVSLLPAGSFPTFLTCKSISLTNILASLFSPPFLPCPFLHSRPARLCPHRSFCLQSRASLGPGLQQPFWYHQGHQALHVTQGWGPLCSE